MGMRVKKLVISSFLYEEYGLNLSRPSLKDRPGTNSRVVISEITVRHGAGIARPLCRPKQGS